MATVPTALAGRHFLKELDFTEEEFRGLIELAAELKAAKRAGAEVRHLQGRNIALIFEKTSTRTRCAFEVAAADQGAHTTYLDPAGSQIGHKESVKDTARVLGRMFDAIEYRGDSQDKVEELAAQAGVPVYNGLTDDWHPTQMLADVLTMTEHCAKPLTETPSPTSATPASTWATPTWSPAPCSAWTYGSSPPSRTGPPPGSSPAPANWRRPAAR